MTAKLLFYPAILIFLTPNMHLNKFLLTVLLLFACLWAAGQEEFLVKRSLQIDVYNGSSYVPHTGTPTRTVYFTLDPKIFENDYLRISGASSFSLWVNGSLFLDDAPDTTLSINVLTKGSITPVLMAIHDDQEIDPESVAIQVVSKMSYTAASDDQRTEKKSTAFRDFVITALLVLLFFLTGMIRLNTRLSSNYFSVSGIFSLREREEDQYYYRVTSANILFYVFTSLMLGFYLMVVNEFVALNIGLGSYTTQYGSILLRWLELSVMILILVFIKIGIVYTIALLFNMKEVAGFHFFNFIRIILVMGGVLTTVLSIYFILHGQSTGMYMFFYSVISWLVGGWIILLFLKLPNRVSYSVFHLFSYLCATEIIPFLIIIKVLYE